MSQGVAEHPSMAGRKKANFKRNRLELIAEPDLIARLDKQAKRLGLSLSAYVRLACSERAERDEAAEPSEKSKNGGRK